MSHTGERERRRIDHIFDLLKGGSAMSAEAMEQEAERRLCVEDLKRGEESVQKVIEVLSRDDRANWINTEAWQQSEAYSFDDIMSRDVMLVLQTGFVDFVNDNLQVANHAIMSEYNEVTIQNPERQNRRPRLYGVRDDWMLHWLQVKSSETGVKTFLEKLSHKNLSGMGVGEFLTRNRVILLNANTHPLKVNVRGERYTLDAESVILGRTSLEVAKNVRYLTGLGLEEFFGILENLDAEAARSGRLMGYWTKYLR